MHHCTQIASWLTENGGAAPYQLGYRTTAMKSLERNLYAPFQDPSTGSCVTDYANTLKENLNMILE